ncbi:MAG: hypothetical protein CV087_21160 [Candidatus Brocadia sp. WS118]|nr:MAG: hypothetical protein CV087_21160 [Candidatus Brocadia sp. WS118]
MANPEHLEILRMGVKVWNQWRKENKNIVPDLREADLTGIQLGVENFSISDLGYQRKIDPYPNSINLNDVNLSNAVLSHANLVAANLNGAILDNAKLDFAQLFGAKLTNANINNANLQAVTLASGNLYNSKFQKTNLSEANLEGANLEATDLSGSDLTIATIRVANLRNSNLSHCNLTYSDLRESDLSGAIFTGANLYYSALQGWIIKDIKCDYVYFDYAQKFENRIPKDRDFEPGEFERLYREVPTIEIEFNEGITLMGMAVLEHVTRKIQEERPDLGLRFIAVDSKGLYPKTRFELYSTNQGDKVKDLIVQELQQIRQDQQKSAQIIAQTILGELQGLGDDVRGQLRIIKQDVKALPREFKRHLDAATQKILDNAGIHKAGIIQLAEQIRSNETAIQKLSQLRDSDINEIEDIKERLFWLKPYFEDVFKKKFDTTGTKVVRAVFKAVSTHFAGDILGD